MTLPQMPNKAQMILTDLKKLLMKQSWKVNCKSNIKKELQMEDFNAFKD